MSFDSSHWPEHTAVLERLLCPPLSAPLSQKQYGALRTALNSLVEALAPDPNSKAGKNKTVLIRLNRKPIGWADDSRERWLLHPDDATLLWNAILLQGLFGTPKFAVALISKPSERPAYVEWARQLFLDRQSVAGLGLLRQELITFLDRITEADLAKEKLPNPFADALPQMGIGPHKGNLLKTLATQTAALSVCDSMMAHYLNGELEQAYRKACDVQTDNALLLMYRDLIINEYQEAKEFDDLLDFLR